MAAAAAAAGAGGAGIVPDEATAIFAGIKAGTSPKAWLVLSLAEGNKSVHLTASGRCGVKHLRRFLDDATIQFGIFRVFALGLKEKQPRFCFFTFKGSKAPLKVKAAAGNLQGPVAKHFEVRERARFTAPAAAPPAAAAAAPTGAARSPRLRPSPRPRQRRQR